MDSQTRAAAVVGTKENENEVQKLKDQLAQLQDLYVVVKNDLRQMGFRLEAAEKAGWVSVRAKGKQRRKEAKKEIQAQKWAKAQAAYEHVRRERKKAGLPIQDPTPSPSEAAYRERALETKRENEAERLRNRVRRTSHQLLIAAAIGQQYREVTMADHSGHVVPGADSSVPLRYRALDDRSSNDGSLSSTEAMARAIRNWARSEHESRVRGRSPSRSWSTVVAPSRSTGSEDSSSGSDHDGSETTGLRAMRATVKPRRLEIIQNEDSDEDMGLDPEDIDVFIPYTTDEDDEDDDEDNDDDEDDDIKGLSALRVEDVSPKIVAGAYNMMEKAKSGVGGWVDALTDDLLDKVSKSNPLKSSSSRKTYKSKDKTRLADTGNPPRSSIKSNPAEPASSEKPGKGNDKTRLADTENPPPRIVSASAKFPAAVSGSLASNNNNNNKGPSKREPNKPAQPSRSVYDPRQWQNNQQYENDSTWVRQALMRDGQKLPEDKTETGWVTWKEHEARFRNLEERLRLEDVSEPHSMKFDAATVDTRVWDPFNRAILEPKSGKREPLRLNPVTIHSLARWGPSDDCGDPPREPSRLPENPMSADKKRPLPSATLAMTMRKSRTVGTRQKNKKVTFAGRGQAKAAKVVARKETPSRARDSKSPPVASVHYPLRSPTATSISATQAEKSGAGTRIRGRASQAMVFKASPPGPPTPYPRNVTAPDTPTVALYEHPTFMTDREGTPSVTEVLGAESEKEKAETISRDLSSRSPVQSEPSSDQSDDKKRPADQDWAGPEEKKRRTSEDDNNTVGAVQHNDRTSSSDSEKENIGFARLHILPNPVQESMNPAIPGPVTTGGTSLHIPPPKHSFEASSLDKGVGQHDEQESVAKPEVVKKNAGSFPPKSMSRGQQGTGAKSVRFDLQSEGPNEVMKQEARRAIGRYGLTSKRRGPLGPFR